MGGMSQAGRYGMVKSMFSSSPCKGVGGIKCYVASSSKTMNYPSTFIFNLNDVSRAQHSTHTGARVSALQISIEPLNQNAKDCLGVLRCLRHSRPQRNFRTYVCAASSCL